MLKGVDASNKVRFVQARPQTRLANDKSDADPQVRGVPQNVMQRLGSKRLLTGGEVACPGAVSGRLLVINNPGGTNPERDDLALAIAHMRPGDILLARTTNIGWTGLFPKSAGLITERGGTMSHSAIIAREHDIPAMVGAQDFIGRLEKHCDERHVQRTIHAPGVWSLEGVTLDANNQQLFLAPATIQHGRLSDFLQLDAPDTGTAYYDNRVEFAHFHDSAGGKWTGKPDHALCVLQFSLYFNAWQRAFDRLNLSEAERYALPLIKSVAIPASSSTAERQVGKIRVGSSKLTEPHEYFVIAFPTERLARLGDRIRENGLNPIKPDESRQALHDILTYHSLRRATYARFTDLTRQLERTTSPTEIDFERVFAEYTELISFAHMRAAFRRRVAGPMMAAALDGLPESERRLCRALILRAWTGMSTETTHHRDVEYQSILLEITAIPELHQRFRDASPRVAIKDLRVQNRRIYRRLMRLAATYKIERSQPDRFEDNSSLRHLARQLSQDLANNSQPPSPRAVFTRTRYGYIRELERLRKRILNADPAFDFETFKQVLILAWEVPILTDGERHVQHRCHYQLRRWFRQIEPVAIKLRLIEPGSRLWDLSPTKFLEVFEVYRQRTRTQS